MITSCSVCCIGGQFHLTGAGLVCHIVCGIPFASLFPQTHQHSGNDGTLQKNDGYFNPYVRLSQLHLSIPGTIECAECVGDLLSNEAIEQLRKRELQVD